MAGSPRSRRISVGSLRDRLRSGPAPRSPRSRSRSGTPAPVRRARRAGRPSRGGSCGRPAGARAGRSSAAAPESWKPTRSAPSRPSRIWRRHGQLGEQLGRRERDVQVEPDAQVGSQLAQHRRDQLELVVLHPDDGVLGGVLRGRVGEALVDRDVGLPPLAVEGRLGHQVVVERPEGGVGEALVELVVLLLATSSPGPGSGRRPRRARGPPRCRRATRSRRRCWLA